MTKFNKDSYSADCLTQSRRVSKSINSKIQNGCPMCGSRSNVLIDGYFNHTKWEYEDPNNIAPINNRTNQSIPYATVSCQNCGFIMNYALGTLGLMPK